GHDVGLEPESARQLLQERGIAAGPPPESMIEPDDDLLPPEAPEEPLFHEGLRLDRGELRGEAQDNDAVHAGPADQRQALLDRRDAAGRARRLQDLDGI